MACYQRPQRTRRAISCILSQTLGDWEAFITGDHCPCFGTYGDLLSDPRIRSSNTEKNYSGYGFFQHNLAIVRATGEYFVFMGNDDKIAPDHLEFYLSEIEGSDLDFVWFDDYTLGQYHSTSLMYCSAGHSNIVVRTAFLKQMPPHDPIQYTDWNLIHAMMQKGKYRKALRNHATYYIMTNPANRIDPENID
jgi:hypothetical protein